MGLEIRRIRVLRGANVFALFPVVYGEIKLNEFYEISSADVEGFIDNIIYIFPGLKDHKCSYGVKGGFIKRLKEGTYLPHIAEHVAIEIQRMLGIPVKFGKSIWIMDDIYWVAVEYQYCEKTAKMSLRYAIEIVEKLMSGEKLSKEDVEVYLLDIEKIYQKERLGPSTRAIIVEAKKRGIPVTPIHPEWSMFQLGYGKELSNISATVTSKTSLLSADIAKDKYMTKKILADRGVHVPKGEIVTNMGDAVAAAKKIGFPLVVKPLDSHHGHGVITNITRMEDVKLAFKVASRYSRKIIVEEYVEGDDYRFLVINGKMVAAAKRVPPYVIGDGKRTIKELVDELNKDPLRGPGHENYLTIVKLGEEEINYLRHQGFRVTDVLPAGIKVYLRKNANLSTGGTAEDVTDDICPEIAREIERAARIIGLDVCGVDAIIKDSKKPLGRGNGAIIEINAAPGLRMHLRPTCGKPRNVAKAIIDHLFSDGDGRIPVIAITGTNGKTSVVRLVSKILQAAGYTVGMTTTGGIYINENKIVEGDTTGPWSAGVVLSDKRVDVAVLEVARGGIWRRGLGYDRAYIGCVLNIREDHIGVDGIENIDDIFWIKSLVTEAVLNSGYSVVNGEDRYAPELLKRARGQPAIFSLSKNSFVTEKIENGIPAAYVDGECVIFHYGKEVEKVMKISDMKYSLYGKLTVNLENALAAILISKLMGLSNKIIENVLKNTEFNEFSGRFNIVRFENKTVVIDYAHNPDAIKKLKELVTCLDLKKTWCVVAIPGDRDDEMLRKNGEALATVFDTIIITAREKDLRGRDKRDLLRKIKEGAERIPGRDIIIENDVYNAIKMALERAECGDGVFILLGLNSIKEFEEYFHMCKTEISTEQNKIKAV